MLADSSWATVKEREGGQRERESIRREGRQWLNTGLTIKTAYSVVFEVCSAAERCSNFSLQLAGTCEGGERKNKETSRFLCDLQIVTGLTKHYLLLGRCWSITCHSSPLLYSPTSFPPRPAVSPVWYCDRADADHSPRLSWVRASCQTGTEQCVGM